MRPALVHVHRFMGLATALFLLVAGLTGSVLAFYEDLDEVFAPSLYRAVAPSAEAQPLDAFTLRERALVQIPGAAITYLPLHVEPARNLSFFFRSADGGAPLEFDNVFIDPYTGDVAGIRKFGDLSEGVVNTIPFLYRLHYQLALGTVGTVLMGLVALAWTLDCFIGLYLTFPLRIKRKGMERRPPRRALASWLKRWRPAWAVRWPSTSYKLNVDLHRAGGLWIWAMLLVLAWSGVAFNLREEAYDPVMGLVFEMESATDSIPALPAPLYEPPIGFRDAAAIGATLASRQTRQHDLEAGDGYALYYHAGKGVYHYTFASRADIRDDPSSRVMFSARDGSFAGLALPNRESAGNQITTWILALHTAEVGGLAMQIFICALGLVVALLSVTGIVIWWKKRSARAQRRVRPARQAPVAAERRETA